MTITSPDNQKLKLIRRLRRRRVRAREALFVTEGEDLLAQGLAAGLAPAFVLRAVGVEGMGEEVEPALLADVSELGSSTRVIAVWPVVSGEPGGPVCVYLHGVGDPQNVGSVIRTAHALVDGTVALGPGCADPFSPKATRASMGSVLARPPARCDVAETPAPRIGLVAHGGREPTGADLPVTLCVGAEREGLPTEVQAACEELWTIPLAPGGAESLNLAAAAAIALGRISSAAAKGSPT